MDTPGSGKGTAGHQNGTTTTINTTTTTTNQFVAVPLNTTTTTTTTRKFNTTTPTLNTTSRRVAMPSPKEEGDDGLRRPPERVTHSFNEEFFTMAALCLASAFAFFCCPIFMERPQQ